MPRAIPVNMHVCLCCMNSACTVRPNARPGVVHECRLSSLTVSVFGHTNATCNLRQRSVYNPSFTNITLKMFSFKNKPLFPDNVDVNGDTGVFDKLLAKLNSMLLMSAIIFPLSDCIHNASFIQDIYKRCQHHVRARACGHLT